MNRLPRIAILADYPAWTVLDNQAPESWHYTVWLTALSQAFSQQEEWEIHWVTLARYVGKAQHVKKNGQYFHVLPRGSRTLGLYTAYLRERLDIARCLRKIQPDLVHSWGTEDCYGLCCKDFPGRKLHSIQGLLKAYMQRGRVSRFLRHQSFFEPRVLRSIPYLTAESPWAAARAREISPHAHVFLWEYAVEARFFGIKRQLTDTPMCLFGGTSAPIKNISTLIEAFSQAALSHVNLVLAGVHRECLPADLPPNIIALGGVSREKMAELLSQTWCLVHASLADTGPVIVKEARVAGVPVVISDQCGSCQHVVDGISGIVVNPMDVSAIVRGIQAITNSPEESIRRGKHGQQECRAALSDETMIRNISLIYKQLLT